MKKLIGRIIGRVERIKDETLNYLHHIRTLEALGIIVAAGAFIALLVEFSPAFFWHSFVLDDRIRFLLYLVMVVGMLIFQTSRMIKESCKTGKHFEELKELLKNKQSKPQPSKNVSEENAGDQKNRINWQAAMVVVAVVTLIVLGSQLWILNHQLGLETEPVIVSSIQRMNLIKNEKGIKELLVVIETKNASRVPLYLMGREAEIEDETFNYEDTLMASNDEKMQEIVLSGDMSELNNTLYNLFHPVDLDIKYSYSTCNLDGVCNRLVYKGRCEIYPPGTEYGQREYRCYDISNKILYKHYLEEVLVNECN